MKTKKKPKKNQTPQRNSGRLSLAAWVMRAPGRATQAARAPGRATQAVRDLGVAQVGHATQAARPGPRELFLSLSLIWSPSLSSDLTLSLSLIWSDLMRWGCAWNLKFFKFFWFINRVLETRFLSSHHVEKDATSDMIKP